MSTPAREIALRCSCGQVHGVARKVAPSTGLRFICYCGDCQAFARFLQRPDVVDAAGGTDIFHMPAGRIKFTAGTDVMRCLQFSSRVIRWYTACCRTPIANTAAFVRFPVVGIIHSLMRHDADRRSRDEVLGAPVCRIFEQSATAPLPPGTPSRSFGIVAGRGPKLLGWWLRGLGRPNPFFDVTTQAPLSRPRAFTPSERATL